MINARRKCKIHDCIEHEVEVLEQANRRCAKRYFEICAMYTYAEQKIIFKKLKEIMKLFGELFEMLAGR